MNVTSQFRIFPAYERDMIRKHDAARSISTIFLTKVSHEGVKDFSLHPKKVGGIRVRL